MMMSGFHRALRILAWLAGALVLLFVCLAAVKLLVNAPSKATGRRLNTALEISGILAFIATIPPALVACQELFVKQPLPPRVNPLAPHLMRDDRLVDRASEMTMLLERMDCSQVVNCHGQRGAGKSFLLEHLADVINGHRAPGPEHPSPTRVSAALYFDLADAVGFEHIQSQVCQRSFGKAEGSWQEFVAYVDETFARRPVLLILDNANTSELWSSLGRAAYSYLATRSQDHVVLGSIDPVVLNNIAVRHVPIPGLDRPAIGELAAGRGVHLDPPELSELYEQCDGLPYFVGLLTARDAGAPASRQRAVSDAVVDAVIPRLEAETRTLLAYVSLLAIVSRQVSLDALERYPVAHLQAQVQVAESWSLLKPIPSEAGPRLLKIHDIARDAVLRTLLDEVSAAATVLFERSRQHGRTIDAAIYAMFADPLDLGAFEFDEILNSVIRGAVSTRNYALLANLHDRASENERVLRFLASDQPRDDLFCYGRAAQLAGIGQYSEAQDTLLSSSIVSAQRDQRNERSELQAEMQFLQADLAHLQNRYDDAAEMFGELGAWAATAGRGALHARCVWGRAHVMRHQGRELDLALRLFDETIGLAEQSGELFAKAYSITGATAIKVFTGIVPDDEERVLGEIESEIAATTAHDGYMLEVWKSQAQVAWYRDQPQHAFATLEAAVDRALALNDRLLYNLYFERADFLRLSGDTAAAVIDYQRVLDFGRGNGDRNLVSLALLGLVSVELATGRALQSEANLAARASVLQARDIALAADIQVSAQAATELAVLLDAHVGESVQPPRLAMF
jgi:tetratricopeptide (TPR) repeat protein